MAKPILTKFWTKHPWATPFQMG